MELEAQVSLPFDPAKQLAILGHLLLDNTFFQQCRGKLKPDWFNDLRHGKVYQAMLDHCGTFGRKPTIQEVQGSPVIMGEKEPERGALQGIVVAAKLKTSEWGLDVIRRELTEWYHARLYREGVVKSQQYYNNKEFHKAYQVIAEKVQALRTARFDEELDVDFDDFAKYLSNSEKTYDDACTTGLEIFDAALRPEGRTGGGLAKKDTTILLAPSNVGKTTAMITMIRHNIFAGKSVLFFTHEGRPDDIREKLLCSMLKCTKAELFELYKTEKGTSDLGHAVRLLKKYLVYIPYNRAGMNVEDVVPIIRRRQEQRIAESPDGKGFDMLVCDYPAKLGTERANRGNLQRRHIDQIVYDYYVQLALELDMHALLAIQTNRAGSKVNRDDERLLTMEDVLESWDTMTMATNVISINRDGRAMNNNRVTFYVAKSRANKTDRAIVCRSNYGCALTHSQSLGGTWYWGHSTLSDQVDQFLVDFNGQAVPESKYKS